MKVHVIKEGISNALKISYLMIHYFYRLDVDGSEQRLCRTTWGVSQDFDANLLALFLNEIL